MERLKRSACRPTCVQAVSRGSGPQAHRNGGIHAFALKKNRKVSQEYTVASRIAEIGPRHSFDRVLLSSLRALRPISIGLLLLS
jgi:hypothetical protein